MPHHTLRRCRGNRTMWAAEPDPNLIPYTGPDLGRLIEQTCQRARAAGEPFPTFTIEITEEGENAARSARHEAELVRIEAGIAEARDAIDQHTARRADIKRGRA